MSLDVGLETGTKKVFAWAVDWPGWCRSGKTESEALERLVAYRDRYAAVVAVDAMQVPTVAAGDVRIVDRSAGGSGTDFGVPSRVTDADRRASSASEAARQAAIVVAAWRALDAVVAAAPAELRKGPRGGGRDRDKVVAHTVDADGAYAHEVGIKRRVDPFDRQAVAELREAILSVLGQPSDGSPLAERTWPARYAARRIAWHALDHAWEIEDRTER